MNIRCFVGLELPDAVATSMVDACDAVRGAQPSWVEEKWVPKENLHVTTCFIGTVPQVRLGALSTALEAAVLPHAPFELRLSGMSAIPRPVGARMLWANFDDPSGGARVLAQSVLDAALPFGAEPDARPFRAHATVCRARRPHKVSSAALAAGEAALSAAPAAMSVVSATLFSSRLTPRGPVYERLAVWQLMGV